MAPVKLCVTVTGRTMAELRQRRDAVKDADLVELRLDGLADPDVAASLDGRRHPVIVTCRPVWEGGQFTGSEEERLRLLRDAQRLGAEFVDVEWKAGFTELVRVHAGRGVIVSMHDFDGVPADLTARAAAMRATGAQVVKIAVTAHRLRDCLALQALGRTSGQPMALVAMGDAGVPSRMLAQRFGSCWTYAGEGVAPGQVPPARLVDELAVRRVTDRSAVYGVVGRPVMHSISPAMHNAAFAAAGRDAVYIPLPAADFDDFLEFAEALDVIGASVTAPFKIDACARAVEVDPLARRIGAANTLRRAPGGWQACNTDVDGFLRPLRSALQLPGTRATILGAGGAARAAAEALNTAGASVSLAARRRDRAERVARLAGVAVSDWPPAAGSWDLLVNATPIGTAPDVDDTPLPHGPFTGALVYDLVYNPPETTLLNDARAAGCRTLGGLEMLVAQAERQFEWWTGAPPPHGVMRAAGLRALRARADTSAPRAPMEPDGDQAQ